MPKLHELAYVYEQLRSNEELSPEDLTVALANIEALFTEKTLSLARWILDLQGEQAAIESEVARLEAHKKSVKARIDSIKRYVAGEMERANQSVVKDDLLSVRLQNSPQSVAITNESVIPEPFWRIIKEVDKGKILAEYKLTGATVVGTQIVTDRKHVVIR